MPSTTWTPLASPATTSVTTSVTTTSILGVTFVQDSFTDATGTNLSAHTGELGATWAKNISASGGDVQISSGGSIYHATGINGSFYYASGVQGADYQVIATVANLSAQPVGIADVLARCSTTTDTRYGARYSSSTPAPGWSLYKVVGGTSAAVGVASGDTIAPGSTRSVILQVSGTSITLFVNGASVISAKDSSITLAGLAGISLATVSGAQANGANGLALDNFSAKGLDSASTTTVITSNATLIPAWTAQGAAAASWTVPSGASTPWSNLT